jgi:predicted acylesterase/phospholipase RssA
METRRSPHAFLVLALLVALTACQTLPRPGFTQEELAAASPPFRYDFSNDAARSRFEADTRRAGQAPADGRFDLLALSGGGANGAFGAGIMTAWDDQPAFEVVTGVSTGALIAPFVFAGRSFDPALTRAYTSGQTEGLLKSRGLLALFLPGVFNPAPLRDLVLDNVDDALLRAVAAEHARGRRLYVATTSLDTQTQIVWDMGALATQDDVQSRLLFVNVLIASASIPGAFPPVPLTYEHAGREVSEVHVDGGTVANFLVAPEPLLLTDNLGSGGEGRIWVLINGKPDPKFQVATLSPARIAARSFDTMMKAITRSDLASTAQFARANGMTMNVAMIGADVEEDSLDFGRENMLRLYQAGQQAMRDGKAWRTVIDEEGKASPILAPRTQSSSSDAVAAETAPDQD